MAILPFGEFLPDGPQFGNPGTTRATNVVPRSLSTYGPWLGGVPSVPALPARVVGSYGYRDPSDAAWNFTATAARIYLQKTGATAFADVSGPSAPYTTATPPDPAAFWSITSFGQRIIATNYNNNVQTYLVGTDTLFSDLAAAAPRARFACVIRDFLMLGNTVDSVDGVRQTRLHWPAIGNPLNWPTPGSIAAIAVQRDFQDLQQTDLGAITGLVGGQLSAADGAAFCERGIYRIAYAGSPEIFDFAVAQGSAGTDASLSIVLRRASSDISGNPARGVAYYLAEDGFAAFDGSGSLPIGAQKVDRFFYSDLDVTFRRMVQGTADPSRKLIIWFYHGAGNNGLFNRAIIYNYEIARWAIVDMTPAPVEWAAGGVTYSANGYTLDQLDTVGNLDALPYSLDSEIWTGGQANPLCWYDGNHQQNFATGPAFPVTIETPEQQLTPGRRSRIISTRPLTNSDRPASIAVGTRETTRQSATYQLAIPENIIGDCPQRCTGRYTRFQVQLPAGANFSHLLGVDVRAMPEGIR